MRPLSEFPASACSEIRIILSDIDDTLTTNGQLPAASLAAMEALSEAGFILIPVTGRPAGWCDHIARMWPVHAVVGENGAFYFSYDRARRKMRTIYAKTDQQRSQDRRRLDQLRGHILKSVPGAGVASDQAYRVADLAIDFCEDVVPLPVDQIERIVALFKQAGATAKVSSIHVNGWFGDYNKLGMTQRCVQELFKVNLIEQNHSAIFIGDSPNDAPMFAFFKHSVGVANVHDFALATPPQWVTRKKSAAGFIEFADFLLQAGKV